MSKKRRRKKMKPYQVKLRIIGVLSLIVAMLVVWLPIWSEAANDSTWQSNWVFNQTDTDYTNDHILKLGKYTGPAAEAAPEASARIGNTVYEVRLADQETTPVPYYQSTTLKSLDLSALKTTGVTSFERYFAESGALEKWIAGSSFDTSAITNMKQMFQNDKKLTVADVSGFNTSAVTDFSYMFGSCESLTSIDVSNFDTSSAIHMGSMFEGCTNLQVVDVSKFDTSKAETLSGMFKDCSSLTDLTISIDAGSVTGAGLNAMFQGCSSLSALTFGTLSTNKVEDFSYMFSGCASLTELDLSKMDCSKATSMGEFLTGCTALDVIDTPVNVPDGVDVALPGGVFVDTNTKNEYSSLPKGTDGTVSRHLVRKTLTQVTGVTLDEHAINLAPTETKQLHETVSPAMALDTSVKWKSSNEAVATVANGLVTAVAEGTATITVTTNEGGKTDTCTVNVVPYTLKPDDRRTDASQHSLQDLTNGNTPATGNRFVVVETSAGVAQSAGGIMMSAQVANTGTFNDVSYFTLSKVDESDVPVNEDFGTACKITLAVPGRMQSSCNSAAPHVYAYNSASGAKEAVLIATEKKNAGTATNPNWVFEFSVDLSGEPALEYALVISDPVYAAHDIRSDPSFSSKVFKTKNSVQPDGKDLYLQVKEIGDSSTKLKPYVEGSTSPYKDYDFKKYYEIYMSYDVDGNLKVADADFKECEVWLSLPAGVDPESPFLTILTENATSPASADIVPKNIGTDGTIGSQEYYQKFHATHFSEFAVVDTASIRVTAEHTGIGSCAITPKTNVFVTTNAAGDPYAAVVPKTEVTVTATDIAGSGYHFDHWEEGSNTYTTRTHSFTPTATTTLTAVFVPDTTPTPTPTPATYKVTFEKSPSAGGDAKADKGSYSSGEKATITATPAAGFSFARWEDPATNNEISTSNPYTELVMDSDKHVRAVFVQGDVAGAERSINVNATVEVSVPPVEATVTVPDINANVNVSIPDVNVYVNGLDGLTAVSGASSSFIPVRIGNAGDMPRTGIGDIYRMLLAMLLVLSGTVEIMLSIPAKKRAPVRRRAI